MRQKPVTVLLGELWVTTLLLMHEGPYAGGAALR